MSQPSKFIFMRSLSVSVTTNRDKPVLAAQNMLIISCNNHKFASLKRRRRIQSFLKNLFSYSHFFPSVSLTHRSSATPYSGLSPASGRA